MAHMTAPHQVVLQRLSEEFHQMSLHFATVAGQFYELQRSLSLDAALPSAPPPQWPAAPAPIPVPPMPMPIPSPVAIPAPLPPPLPSSPPPRQSLSARLDRDSQQNWIGKLLAVAGVAVTLIGVVLLLVLAAQAGILRPELRVAAGAALGAVLVVVGVRLNRRPGGRVGAIALAATGIAAAYMDVVAITTIYGWVPPVAGLLVAATVGGAGLTLARRWDSEQLALLVLVPLIVLAPIVADGVTLLLVGFMIALSAAALPVQLGRDWIWMHAARTFAVTLPMLVALLVSSFDSAFQTRGDAWLLGGACATAALLAVAGALILLPGTSKRILMALLTVAGVLPALAAGIAVPQMLSVLIAAAVAAGMLAIVVTARALPGVGGAVARIWSALSAVAALIAVTLAFDGLVEGPVLLGLALVTAVAGRNNPVARWAAAGFALVGGMLYTAYAPPDTLLAAKDLATPVAISTLISSVLVGACATTIAWSWTSRVNLEFARTIWAGAAAIVGYAVTMLTVTAGVLVGGPDGGFLAGHMAATICWIAAAAALFVIARRLPDREARNAPILGGLALTAAATAKLFLFDLGTLDGMFRVAAFIIVGLVLLGMGAGYARSLAEQDAGKGMPDQS